MIRERADETVQGVSERSGPTVGERPASGSGRPAPAIAVRGLTVARPALAPWRPDVEVLRDVSCTAPTGLVTCLVGTNGAGKTTLLETMIGALRPVRGCVCVDGARMQDAEVGLPAGVAYVPDAPAYPSSWSTEEIVRTQRRLDPDLDVRAIGRMLQRRGIDPRRAVAKLSAGQGTSVSLALALARDPRLLILDEPFARLDPLAREELTDELRDHLAAEPERSVLLSTHDLAGMERFVDHLIVLDAGRVVCEGDVDELCEEHLVVTVDAADARALALRGPRRAGDRVEGLLRTDEAAALPTSATLRAPTLPEIVTFELRESAR